MSTQEPKTITININVRANDIESFHDYSQADPLWANILAPVPADNFVENLNGGWYHEIAAGDTLEFELNQSEDNDAKDLQIEYVRLNPLGVVHYKNKSPLEVWSGIVDTEKTAGAVGKLGAFYLQKGSSEPAFSLVASSTMEDFSPNLNYTILFSFIDTTNIRRYCSVDPLLKTTGRNISKP